jgi:IS5 family transposase
MKGYDYRELEYAQEDSRICGQFVKIDPLRPYSFQMYQKYISRIKAETLEKLMVAINKIAIEEGLEDIEKFRQDSTVVETNIHYPTNNSLVWDCIKEADRLLTRLRGEVNTLDVKQYKKAAKKTYFKINVTKDADKRTELFREQLVRFIKCINQVSNIVKENSEYSVNIVAMGLLVALEQLLPLMKQVFSMTHMKEIKGKKVANEKKLFSIYELHTDIIVKGSREVKFGHKVNLGTGKSNSILTCDVVMGNPNDSSLYQETLNKVKMEYDIVPKSSVTDGGFASLANLKYAQEMGIVNVVFNKVTGSLKSVATSQNMETQLKKWRSGIEAVISNLKRGYNIRRCVWKGFEHFKQKIFWSVIAYNIRVMTGAVLKILFV